jgi:hypothetical protein
MKVSNWGTSSPSAVGKHKILSMTEELDREML